MISDLKITNLSNLTSSMFTRQKFGFRLSGVHPPIKVILFEAIQLGIPIRILNVDVNPDTFDTDNAFIQINHLRSQVQGIPIKQDIPLDALFKINIRNETSSLMIVTSNSIVCTNYDDKYFDINHPIFSLKPGQFLRLDKIMVEEHISKTTGNSSAITAHIDYDECLDSPAVVYEAKDGKHHTKNMLAEDIEHYTGISDMLEFIDLKGRILVQKSDSKYYDVDNLPSYSLYKKVIKEDLTREIKFVGAFDVIQLNHYLRFRTDGNVEPQKIISYAIDYVKKMFSDIREHASLIRNDDGFIFGYIGCAPSYAYAITFTAKDIAPELSMQVMDKAGSQDSWEIYSEDDKIFYSTIDQLLEKFSELE